MTAATRSTVLVEAGRDWGKPLTQDDARALTAQIRTSVEELLPLIRTAYQRRADLALGYGSWDEYCDAELSGLRMSLADRPEAVAALRSDGMSQRAIGAALGISAATVNRTLSGVSPETPAERIEGTDGKTYAATRPATQTPGPVDAAATPPADPGATSQLGDEATPASAVVEDPPATGDSPGSFAAPGAGADQPAPPPGSPATWTPEQHEQNRLEIQRVQIIERAQRRAPRLVAEIRGLINEVLGAMNLGETGLVTPAMVAEIRGVVDILEARMEATQ